MMMGSFLELFAQVAIYSCKQLCNFLTCWWRVRRKLERCGKIRYVKNDKTAPNQTAINEVVEVFKVFLLLASIDSSQGIFCQERD
jgi:hypothetical protein